MKQTIQSIFIVSLCMWVAGSARASDWPAGSAAFDEIPSQLAVARQVALNKNLYSAVLRGDLEAARRLLDEGGDPNNGDGHDTFTPFQAAVDDGNLAMIELLLGRGGSVFPRHEWDLSVLALLASSELEDGAAELLARQLLDLGAPAQYPTYRTPLMAAAASGRLWLIRLLIERGADPNFATLGGDTPLESAVEHDRKAALHLLLGLGAVPADSVAGRGSSPLLTATIYGNAEIVGLLLDHGADPNDRWGGGDYVIHSAGCGEARDLNMMRILIQRGARLDATDINGDTPLHYAAVPWFLDCFHILKFLIAERAPLDAQNDKGKTPLMFSADWGYAKGIHALLEAGASKSVKDKSGKTAQDYAREKGRPRLVERLKP